MCVRPMVTGLPWALRIIFDMANIVKRLFRCRLDQYENFTQCVLPTLMCTGNREGGSREGRCRGWGGATSPLLPSRTPTFSFVTLLLDPTCDIQLSLPFFLSSLFLLSLPSSSLHLGILTPSLPPSLGASTSPTRLFYSTIAPAPLLCFNFWLPSSCPGSCIANRFFFFRLLHIYSVTYMLPPEPCLPLSPMSLSQ